MKAEAQTRARKGLAEYSSHFYGSDSDARVIQRARTNARLAGIGELITFEVKDVAQLTNPLPKGPYGTVLSNPPYGERLDSEPALIALHSLLGRIMKNQFGGWNLSLFSASRAQPLKPQRPRCRPGARSVASSCVQTNSTRRKTARWTAYRKITTLPKALQTANRRW